MSAKLVLLGGGQHGRVLLHHLHGQKKDVAAVYDPGLKTPGFPEPHLTSEDIMERLHPPSDTLLINAVGSVRSMEARHNLYTYWKARGYRFTGVIAANAVIAPSATLAEDVQLMTSSIIEPGSVIGANSIINTGSIVNHDCTVGASVHVSSLVVLSGGVRVGDQTHIGSGAVIIHGINIGRQCLIAAGAVVTQDVPDGGRVYPPRSEYR